MIPVPPRARIALSFLLAIATALSACTDDGSGAAVVTRAPMLVATTAEAGGADCAAGGVRISSGADTNGNAILDASEVSNVQYACNGAGGAASIVRTAVLPVGDAHCVAGGDAVEVGVDTNGNNVLDASEITSTGYVCDGAAGSAGATGPAGPTGTPGTPGIAGTNSDINIVPLAPGLICEYGGYTITAGPDNGSGQIATVTSTAHICDGAPGADVTWVDVTGTSQQAESNTGYLADNAARVTITLPASPAVGDLVRISGAGAGGWTIAQNAGQTIRTLGIPVDSSNWNQRTASGTHLWVSIASSSDGSHLAAADGRPGFNPGYIYTSVDGGANWTQQTGSGQHFWGAIASSSDGSHLAATENTFGGYIYTSADGGLNWTQQTGAGGHAWAGLASSSDGSHLAAGDSNGYIYTSVDGGLNWTQRTASGVGAWVSIASSSDGSHLAATDSGGYIHTSVDGGLVWTQQTASGQQAWTSIASSSDGSHLAAVGSNNVAISADFGVTWTVVPALTGNPWQSIASSADGSRLAAVENNGFIYTSVNFGASWAQSDSRVRGWVAIASSSDGSRLAAAEFGGYIYSELAEMGTTVGTAGSLSGYQYDMIELQYLGGGTFGVLSFTSYSGAFTAQ